MELVQIKKIYFDLKVIFEKIIIYFLSMDYLIYEIKDMRGIISTILIFDQNIIQKKYRAGDKNLYQL